MYDLQTINHSETIDCDNGVTYVIYEVLGYIGCYQVSCFVGVHVSEDTEFAYITDTGVRTTWDKKRPVCCDSAFKEDAVLAVRFYRQGQEDGVD